MEMSDVPRGRPALPEDQRRSSGFRVRLRHDEAELVRSVAADEGVSVAEYIRRAALEAAAKARGQAGSGL